MRSGLPHSTCSGMAVMMPSVSILMVQRMSKGGTSVLGKIARRQSEMRWTRLKNGQLHRKNEPMASEQGSIHMECRVTHLDASPGVGSWKGRQTARGSVPSTPPPAFTPLLVLARP